MISQADAALGFCTVCGAKRLVAGQDHCATCGAKLPAPPEAMSRTVAGVAPTPTPATPPPPAGWAQQAPPQAAWAQQAPPQAGWAQPSAPVYVVGGNVTSAALQMAIGKYMQRRYRQIPSAGAGVALERRPDFHVTMAFLLLFLFGIGALIYIVVYAVQLQANTRRVDLVLRPDGQVDELGYTLHDLDRDTLVLARRWRLFWAVVLGIVGVLFVLTGVSELVTPAGAGRPATELDAVVVTIGIGAMAFAGAWYLWRRAGRIGLELRASYPIPH